MAVAAALPPLHKAAITRLIAAVPMVAGRIYGSDVPPDAARPYLVLSGHSEVPNHQHYDQGGSESGFDIRGVYELRDGQGRRVYAAEPWMALYKQVYAALFGVPLAIPGHQWLGGIVVFVTDFPEPTDAALRHLVMRYTAGTVVL